VSRLIFSYAGTVRRFQISQVYLWVFVEGDVVDAPFYDQVCAANSSSRSGFSYEIVKANEVSGVSSGGKMALLALHAYLKGRARLSLKPDFTTLFFLDKDIDDIKRSLVSSLHICYTPTYDVEGVVYSNGDLVRAISAMLGVSSVSVRGNIRLPQDWVQNSAELWSEWIAICLLINSMRSTTGWPSNFSSPSQVNAPWNTSAGRTAIDAHLKLIEGRTGLTLGHIRRQYKKKLADVRVLSFSGRILSVFSGKWFGFLIEKDLEGWYPAEARRIPSLGARMAQNLLLTIDYSSLGMSHFHDAIDGVI